MIRSELAPDPTTRLAVIDTDSGFVTVLAKRAEAAGWLLRTSGGAVPPDQLVAMKLNALLVDPAVLGDEAWRYLDRVCSLLPDLGVEAVTRRHRRGRNETESAPVLAGELEIRPDRFQAFVSGDSLDLTRREFELLHLLAGTQGQVLERETIYQRVWGYAMAHGDRSVDVFIRKLRQKLEKRSPEWEYIHTHFGVGYRFDPEPSAGATPESPAAPSKPAAHEQSSQVVHKSFTAA
jgi:DNA-binding winged helix-turn-helix (wHTH) protein